MPKRGTEAHARHMRRLGSVVVEWHGCDGAALRVIPHAIEGSTASTKLAYSIPRSNIGLRSSDDAAGDTHAITRGARGTDKRIAAVLHASAPRCGCCAVTTIAASPARVIAVVVSPASNVRHRSRCSTIDCPSTPCAMIGCPSTRWLTVGCETTLLMSRCFPCAIPKRRSMPPAMHAAREGAGFMKARGQRASRFSRSRCAVCKLPTYNMRT
jgi:hypothetical protein